MITKTTLMFIIVEMDTWLHIVTKSHMSAATVIVTRVIVTCAR